MTDDKPISEQLLDELAPWIAKGDIVVHEKSDYWWNILRSKYPVAIGQIDWLNVPNWQYNLDAVPHIPEEGVIRGEVIRERSSVIRKYLQEFANTANISPHDHIIVLGDGLTDEDFEMSFETLLTAFPILFLPSQHVYVIPLYVHVRVRNAFR
jgi:hypothetical protein